MEKRKRYAIVPHTKGWAILILGNSKPIKIYKLKNLAIIRAKSLAKKNKFYLWTEINVHNRKGKLEYKIIK